MPSAGKMSCCILTEIYPEFWSRPIQQKQILTGLLVTTIYKNRTMKISLLNYSMLGYISPITTPLPHIYRRNPCPTHIFKPTNQTWLQAWSHSGIFQRNLPWFGTFMICTFLQLGQPGLSSTIFCKKLDFPLSTK